MVEQTENIVGMRKKIKAQAEHVRRLEQRIRELKQAEQQPVRVVVDISGGAIHGVYADRPVTIYFKSDDTDDVAHLLCDLDESEVDKDMKGEPIASWVHDAELFSDIVDHYHNQAKESGND